MRIGNFQLNRCKDLRSCTDYCNIHPRPSRNACPSNLPDRDSNRPSRGLPRNGHHDGRWAVGRDHDCSHYYVDDDKRPHLFGKMRLRSRANSDNGIRWCRPDKWLRSDMDPIGIRRYRLDNRRRCNLGDKGNDIFQYRRRRCLRFCTDHSSIHSNLFDIDSRYTRPRRNTNNSNCLCGQCKGRESRDPTGTPKHH